MMNSLQQQNSNEKWTSYIEEQLANDHDGHIEAQLLEQLSESEKNILALQKKNKLPEEQLVLAHLQDAVHAAQKTVQVVASRFRKLRSLRGPG